MNIMTDTETIKWFKVESSFYQQVFAIKRWKDVVDFVNRHKCFDVNVKGPVHVAALAKVGAT